MSEIYKIVSEIERNQIISKLSKGKRMDGRSLDEYREWKIQTGVVEKADGSARVDLGETKVIAGIKADVGEPYPDTPNEGVLTMTAEFVPMAYPTFEPGPPGFEAIELARVVDRGIRHGEVINREELCLIPGKKVWILFLDIYVIDHSGNLFDAASMAANAALKTCTIPEVKIEGDEIELNPDKRKPLPIIGNVASVTIAKIGDHIVLDPDASEERIMDSRITIAFNERRELCAIQKGGESSFKYDEVLKAIDLAKNSSEIVFNEIAKVK